MWPSIKRWRDWAMLNLRPMQRLGPQPQELHYGFEKAGLTLRDQPIPWNAEVVVVEALLRLYPPSPRRKVDYSLRIPGREPIPADSLRHQGEERARLSFRLPVPAHTVSAEICCRNSCLGQLTLPVVSRDEFVEQLRLETATLFVRLGDESVACQTFVASQSKGLLASALISSPTASLVPLLDLGLQVEISSEHGPTQIVPARLCSSQLADKKALVSVVPRRFPRRMGTWTATWSIAGRTLATQQIRAISQKQFLRSLRVTDARFLVQNEDKGMTVTRQAPPLDEVSRLGPCFLVGSSEPGMAGLCDLQVRLHVNDGIPLAELPIQQVLVTDGPTMVAPGTLDADDMDQVCAFELLQRGEPLGLLSLRPAPTATFTAEGGFKAPGQFAWSLAADEELNDRLTRLLHGE